MYKIIGYRIINGHTVTHKSRKRKFLKTIDEIEKWEYETACRYMLKDEVYCQCYAIYMQLDSEPHNN